MLKALVKHKFLILIIVLFILLRLPSLFEPYWYGDEGIYLTLGEGIRQGLTLYSQIHDNKPPMLYYLAALGQTVFGFRLLLFMVMIPTVYFFHRLAKKFFHHNTARLTTILFVILTSIPLLEGTIANAEVFMLLPTILGILIFLNAKSNQDYLISGLLLGYAFTIKIPVGFEFLFLTLFLLLEKIDFFEDLSLKNSFKKIFRNLPKFIYLILGFIAPIFLWSIYFYFQGAFKPFILASLLQNFGYLSSWATGNQTSSFASGGLMIRFVVLLLSWLIIFYFNYKKIITKNAAFILAWFAATVFSALLSGRPYPHYLIQLVPPLCLIITGVFSNSLANIRWMFVFSIIILGFVIYKYKFYFYPVFSYYHNFYTYAFQKKSQSDYYSYFGSNVNLTYEIAEFVKANTDKKQTVFIWGDEPYVYALTSRLPPEKFTVAYHVVDFNAYDDAISGIKSRLPKYIIYYPMANRPYPQLDNLIRRYYYPVRVFGSIIVFQLR